MCRPFTGDDFDAYLDVCPCGHRYHMHNYHWSKDGMVVDGCSACAGTLATLELVDCPCGHGHEEHYYKWTKPFFTYEKPKPRCKECSCKYDLHATNMRLGYAIFLAGCGFCAMAKEVGHEAVPIVVRRKKG